MKTISDNTLVSLAVAISAFVVLASCYLWYASPGRRWPYLLAVAVVGVAWMARQLRGRNRASDPASRAARRKLTQAIISSGLLLAFALGGVLIARLG